jgi:hypothetical protein
MTIFENVKGIQEYQQYCESYATKTHLLSFIIGIIVSKTLLDSRNGVP